jgi:glutamine amidotransferase
VKGSGTAALIDYGAGNLLSVRNALVAVGASVQVTADPADILAAPRIVLPGVGSFASCAAGLRAIPGMVDALEQRVIEERTPFLGICVGMQLLATTGFEHRETAGLGWIGGQVRHLDPGGDRVRIPHMGWNEVRPTGSGQEVIESGEAYFLHSYHFVPDDRAHVLAETTHGSAVVAAVGRDNIVGVQFHPEKSQRYGLDLLRRFLLLTPGNEGTRGPVQPSQHGRARGGFA